MAIIEVKNGAGKIIGYREGNGPVYRTLAEAQSKSNECPEATQDIHVNLENRQHAIDEYLYGPLDPDQPSVEYWTKIAEIWKTDDIESVKSARCENCAAFNVTYKMKQCMANGIGNEPSSDAMDVVDAGELGYCMLFKFKCAGKRTCAAWVTGGPIR
jgi:hypothetical protein